MKKINLYMLLIFIAALTGCDDNVNDHFALPQTNPQEPVQNVEGFTLSLGSSCNPAGTSQTDRPSGTDRRRHHQSGSGSFER